MANITAEIPGESKEVIIISSHYDSNTYKDMKFVGANDPGSFRGNRVGNGESVGCQPTETEVYLLAGVLRWRRELFAKAGTNAVSRARLIIPMAAGIMLRN